jgi:hypothetical protein
MPCIAALTTRRTVAVTVTFTTYATIATTVTTSVSIISATSLIAISFVRVSDTIMK